MGETASNEGMIAEVTAPTELFSQPDDLSPSQGELPAGTLLRLLGKRKGAFENIEVELADGVAEGWVRRRSLNLKAQEKQQERWEQRQKEKGDAEEGGAMRRDRRSGKVFIPKDEELLIRRHTTFFYGPLIEIPYAMMDDAANNFYTGLNLRVGGHLGFYLKPNVPMRFEIAYSKMGGSADAASPAGAGTEFEVSFVDVRSAVEWEVGDFSLLGFLQYSFGAGIGAAPASATFSSASNLSSFWLGAGGGYRAHFGENNVLHLQLTYAASLQRDPVGFQALGLRLLWEIRG